MTSLASLPSDVLDQIMSSFLDFRALKACIDTCTTLRRVYEAHPNSILQSVAVNLIGSPALVTAARRSLLVERQLDQNSTQFVNDEEWIKAQLRSVASSEVEEIAWPEAHALEERARVCMEIEIIYSLNHKDRLTADTSCLSAAESEAFRMALLHLWELLSTINSSESARKAINEFHTRQAIFYSRLSNQELYELQLVIVWLNFEMDAVDSAVDPFPGLATIGLKAFLEASTTDDYDCLPGIEQIELDWQIEDDFDALWRDRRVEPPGIGQIPTSSEFKPLLSSRVGMNDTCAKCDTVTGLDLYNCQNWATKRALRFEDARDLGNIYFPGALSNNDHENQMFSNYVNNPLSRCSPAGGDSLGCVALCATTSGSEANVRSTVDVGQPLSRFDILRALFHLDTIVTDEKLQKLLARDGYAHLEPNDWLCYQCLTDLLESRLWIWWYNEKTSGRVIGGSVQREDCGYGFDCQTQTRLGGQHAREFNHLCINTRAEQGLAIKGSNGYSL